MTLEALFSQQNQPQAFLLMVICGFLAALSLCAVGRLHRISRMAGLAGDALCAMLITLAMCQTVIWTGALRFYALLGLVIGALLFCFVRGWGRNQ